MVKLIEEGSCKLKINVPKTVSKDMPVFYNPVMRFNRDVSVILLNTLERKDLKIGLPLAGTGIRGIRLLLETDNIAEAFLNDGNPEAVKIIEENLKLNKVKAAVSNHEASRFLFSGHPFDYIDII